MRGPAIMGKAVDMGTIARRETGATQPYVLLLKGGRVVDPRNRVDGRRDVAIRDGLVTAVAEALDPADAVVVQDVSGTIVTPTSSARSASQRHSLLTEATALPSFPMVGGVGIRTACFRVR